MNKSKTTKRFKQLFMPICALLLAIVFIAFCIYSSVLGFMRQETGFALLVMIFTICLVWFVAYLVVCMVKEMFWIRREKRKNENDI